MTLINKFVVCLLLKICPYAHGISLELVLVVLLNARRGSIATGAGVKKWGDEGFSGAVCVIRWVYKTQ